MSFVLSKEDEDKFEEEDEDVEHGDFLPVFHFSCDIFVHFLHAVTLLRVLHLDVIRRQIYRIEIENEN